MPVKSKNIMAILPFVIILIAALYVFMPNMSVTELTVLYPFDGSMFPPEISAPTVRWEDKDSGASNWNIKLEFQDDGETLDFDTDITSWTPTQTDWETIKTRSLEKSALITITGYKKALGVNKDRSRNSVSIITSPDEVGAPIFFRAVTLPFEFAVNNVETIQWRLGDVSSYDQSKIILDNMPVCGNCHSFSDDGKHIGMDVDYANDKGSYIIADIEEDIDLTNDKVISWSDYKRDDEELTFGLLSQISPDGRYAVSTVKDRSVFVPVDELYYSQLFFPLKGILVYYDMVTKSFHELNGADDSDYVQSNPEWSPDGKNILFAKNEVGSLDDDTGQVLLTPEQCEKYISRRELFKFDIWSIPFNDGKGGKAVPLKGASGNEMSNYFPKYSPDGKWIVFCKASSFMLLQPDSRLYILPSEGGVAREMNCNTNSMNSWHSWSPNGKWMVFSSKAFTPYTQLFLTHIDENGNDSPPVLLSNFTPKDRAANIPEFVNIDMDGINNIHEKFVDYYTYFNKSGQLRDEGRLEEAETFLRKSITLKSDYPESHKRLGFLLASMQRMDEAEVEWNTALKLDSSDHLLHLNLASLYLERQEFDRAEKTFLQTIKLENECAPAYAGLGIILVNRGDYNGAKKRFVQAIEADPGFDDGHYRLGTIYMSEENNEKAEESFRNAIKQNPRSAASTLALARVLTTKDGSVSEALSLYEKALSLNPSNVKAYVELGNLYLKHGDKAQAVNAFERALKVDPSAQYVRDFLARLKQSR